MLKKFEISKLPNIAGDIYKRLIYFFNRYEQKVLLVIQEILMDPDNFVGLYYQAIVTKDTFKYVYEGIPPAYHKSKECPKLHANFKNFEIPSEIRDKGENEVMRFRTWFKENKHIFDTDLKRFLELLELYFYVRIPPNSIDQGNSGMLEIQNYSIEQLETEIDNIIKGAGRVYYADETNTRILRKYSKLTFLAYKQEAIPDNDTGYSDEAVKALLKAYDLEFKRPLKNLLREYYKTKYNPELAFKGELLDNLGFKSCTFCGKDNL
ncbi:hypothetical protein PV783_29335 [Chitinophaga sp. CC14]|uniref:hypothetical protein n=1 Tax=Chitinophaga sp. CC14 TaxID=3029199 RepID=UPI003B781610